jgi:hypothetical protein
MSWNLSHSVGWTDAMDSSCARWIQRSGNSKVIVGWTDTDSGSSDALGFGNGKVCTSVASAPDDLTLRSAVHLTPTFKSYRDEPRFLLQHRMNWRFSRSPAVHLTPLFKSYNDTPSGWPSAPDKPTMRQIIASVHWLGQLSSTAILKIVSDRMIWRLRREDNRFIRRYNFSGDFSNG